jgi:hypothetical protein
MAQLLGATTLTKLQWNSMHACKDMSTLEEPLPQEQVLSTLWQHLQLLPKLTALQLRVHSFTAATIAPLSTLQHLQHFSLRVNGHPGTCSVTCDEAVDSAACSAAAPHPAAAP